MNLNISYSKMEVGLSLKQWESTYKYEIEYIYLLISTNKTLFVVKNRFRGMMASNWSLTTVMRGIEKMFAIYGCAVINKTMSYLFIDYGMCRHQSPARIG